MDEMICKIDRYYNGDRLVIKFKDGMILSGVIDTIYETNNELDECDSEYQEYYACTFLVKKVIKTGQRDYQENDLIEISRFNEPCLILDADDNVVWDANVKKAVVYQGVGNNIEEIDIADIVNSGNTVEEKIQEIARKFIKADAKSVKSVCVAWEKRLYRYVWLGMDEYDETTKERRVGLYNNLINDLAGERMEVHYWPGKIILLKHDVDENRFASMEKTDFELIYSDIDESNRIKNNYKEFEASGSSLNCLTEMIVHKRKKTNQSLED